MIQMETALENILVSAYKEEMISFMDSHPAYFEEAINLAISNKQPYSWRAAWLLWSCMEENDQRFQEYIKKIVNAIADKSDGHQRELLKILLIMDLDEEFEAYVFDVCVKVWEKINKKPSVRLTAFKVMLKIAKKYPDLSNEIIFLCQDHYLESLSPGIKLSIARMIKESAM